MKHNREPFWKSSDFPVGSIIKIIVTATLLMLLGVLGLSAHPKSDTSQEENNENIFLKQNNNTRWKKHGVGLDPTIQ